jgi:hypothetical protein
MKVEISALFGMDYSDRMVKEIHIGDGVYLQEIKLNHQIEKLFERVKQSDENERRALVFREGLEWHVYTHRFYASIEGVNSLQCEEVSLAKQLIMRAIVLSRIIKPMPIPLHPTTIFAINHDTGKVQYTTEINVGFYGTAYLVNKAAEETFTQGQAALMAKHWSASQHIYDNRAQYKRIHRSLMTFNDAYHIRPKHLSHVILHAALESLICTTSHNNKRQVTKRLPQLVSNVTEAQAIDIYEFCCDVKHTAAPGLLYSTSRDNLDPRDARRQAAAQRLEDSLRGLFLRALDNREFAQELEDKKVLEQKYPVPKK